MRSVELVKPTVQNSGKKYCILFTESLCLEMLESGNVSGKQTRKLHSLHKVLAGYICCFLVWLASLVGNDTSESGD